MPHTDGNRTGSGSSVGLAGPITNGAAPSGDCRTPVAAVWFQRLTWARGRRSATASDVALNQCRCAVAIAHLGYGDQTGKATGCR